MNIHDCNECGLLMDAFAEQNVTVCRGGFAHIKCPPPEWQKEMLRRLQKSRHIADASLEAYTASVTYNPASVTYNPTSVTYNPNEHSV